MTTKILFPLCLLAILVCSCQPRQLNILTYNVHHCVGLDKKQNYERIAKIINHASPDVVALQELDSLTQRSNGACDIDSLQRLTNMHAIYAAAIPYQGGSYGIGILSKEKAIGYQIIPMPGREEKRTMIVAEYKNYVFCCTHQSLTAEDQSLSVRHILEALKGIEKPIFLAGDMNSHPIDTPQELLRNSFITLSDTANHTFPANQPNRCIDYIYAYSRNGYYFKVRKKEVIADTIASDHRPVQVIVEF
ncbi:MAG: endonuclease [Mediterranea massiliensis]|nr:endonuclease [Mediterranea massiliensis]